MASTRRPAPSRATSRVSKPVTKVVPGKVQNEKGHKVHTTISKDMTCRFEGKETALLKLALKAPSSRLTPNDPQPMAKLQQREAAELARIHAMAADAKEYMRSQSRLSAALALAKASNAQDTSIPGQHLTPQAQLMQQEGAFQDDLYTQVLSVTQQHGVEQQLQDRQAQATVDSNSSQTLAQLQKQQKVAQQRMATQHAQAMGFHPNDSQLRDQIMQAMQAQADTQAQARGQQTLQLPSHFSMQQQEPRRARLAQQQRAQTQDLHNRLTEEVPLKEISDVVRAAETAFDMISGTRTWRTVDSRAPTSGLSTSEIAALTGNYNASRTLSLSPPQMVHNDRISSSNFNDPDDIFRGFLPPSKKLKHDMSTSIEND